MEYTINIGSTYFLENYTISCPLQLDSLMLVQTRFEFCVRFFFSRPNLNVEFNEDKSVFIGSSFPQIISLYDYLFFVLNLIYQLYGACYWNQPLNPGSIS